ncbi:hypothetical protein ASPWEDRAFT_47287 [Aspergillus wentii DTO 134E9]|uniref:Uncharacterized protein n=1 Tax=Aspergillus wentii DTO 134E9 TaxID=1073089 RepID=A0A1L9RZW7_ASPWE|nr:uncharacterized protein ASPWEDRAFT_47287 [Aspergillus wentii DTO 134E9]KAI9932881.1 hypothetical protein MW887_009133 [Aspergillus wentii]OJJ40465.1 hypothetical protein ASPWEDRAFT_47287 [Aspergillus wentii DTO 134E9]
MYFPKQHRHHKLLIYLMAVEIPFVIIILTFTGIASHDLYRTKLWQDGADNGFNSAPNEIVYAYANHRPFKVPMVWSSFITSYNLVLGVLSAFLMITKIPVHFLRLFYPPLAVIINGSCVALYIVSARYQAGSDTSDPQHPQRGAPWYITKSCSVAKDKGNIGYCKQAKTLFAFSIIIIVLYFVQFVVCLHSCFITPEERAQIDERRDEDRQMKEYEEEVLKSPRMIPMTPAPYPGSAPYVGSMPPTTPRSLAFNRLGGDSPSDLPLRDNSGSLQQQTAEVKGPAPQPQPPQMYFPPPPKKAAKT